MTSPDVDAFIAQSKPFITWMLQWKASLKQLSIADLLTEGAHTVGIVSVDVIKGFCTVGPLASPRIDATVPAITQLFSRAWEKGVRDIALPQDTHAEDAVEFMSYAPHCIRGSEESDTVEAFRALSFFDQMTVIPKNSIACGYNDQFRAWVAARPQITRWIVVGDCTDICTYQLAMYLRTDANEHQIHGRRVVLPVNTVDTYDLPVETAQQIGTVPHDGDFLHLTFLYSMMLNGVEIVTEITA
jgi:nicotinamidase-related amidase